MSSVETIEPAPPEKKTEGPGAKYVPPLGVTIVALYLVAVTIVALCAIVSLWPHPTPAALPVAMPATSTTGTAEAPRSAAKDEVPQPTPQEIKRRQDALCRTTYTSCRDCVEREMQLQYESQRRNDPQCTYLFGFLILLWQEERLLLLVLLGGAVGALLHALRSMVAYVGNRNFIASWLAFYYLSPLAGATLAFVAYIAIRGGFFSSTSSTADTNPFMFVALATFSGLFSQQVLEKLKKIAESAFETPASGKDPLQSTKPVIDQIDPATVPVNFAGPVKVEGKGFVASSVVLIGDQTLATSNVTEGVLTFQLPAALTAAAGKLEIVVQGPGTTGAKSNSKTIEVTGAAGGATG